MLQVMSLYSMGVEGDASADEIIRAVEAAGYGASAKASGKDAKGGNAAKQNQADSLKDTETPKMKKRLIASVILLIPLMYVSMGHMMWNWPLPSFLDGNHVAMGLYELLISALVMVINQKFFISGFKGLIHRSPNMDTLIALGATASFGYSVFALFAMSGAVLKADKDQIMYYMNQFYFESAAMILTLITVGKMLEVKSKGKTTNALKALMNLAPETAVLLVDGVETTVPVEEVKVVLLLILRLQAVLSQDPAYGIYHQPKEYRYASSPNKCRQGFRQLHFCFHHILRYSKGHDYPVQLFHH